jgi:hypothetical protein
LELGVVFLNLLMAVHADLGCRDIGVSSNLHKAVAITAIHTDLLDVNLVGEGNRLGGLVAHIGILICEVVPKTR